MSSSLRRLGAAAATAAAPPPLLVVVPPPPLSLQRSSKQQQQRWRRCVASASPKAPAQETAPQSPADLLEWPEGLRPKRGGVTRASLLRLRTSHLQQELGRLSGAYGSADTSALKKAELAEALLQAVQRAYDRWHDAPAARGGGDGATAAAAENGKSSGDGASGGALPTAAATKPKAAKPKAAAAAPAPVDEAEAAALAAAAAAGVDVAALPELPSGNRGVSYDVAALPLKPEETEMVLVNNRTMLMLCLMGTSGDPNGGACRAPCAALLRGKDVWLVDVGEDTQRAFASFEHVRASKVSRIFLSSLRPERVLGLPGLICTISGCRERGHETADIPLHVYGPPGTADFLAGAFQVSATYIEIPILVYEFTPAPVAEAEPQLFNSRAKIWHRALPPDQLNPDGWVDGELTSFMPTQGRARVRKGSRAAGGPLSSDPRAGFRPLPLPPPGDPAKDGDVDPEDMTWTVRADESAAVTVALLDGASPPVFGFTVREADRAGGISVARCEALGVAPGEGYARLKAGEPWPGHGGVLVPPALVVSPNRPGRTVAVAAACHEPERIARIAAGADVLVADACCGPAAAQGPFPTAADADSSSSSNGAAAAGPTPIEQGVAGVACVAAAARVAHLVLTGFRPRALREFKDARADALAAELAKAGLASAVALAESLEDEGDDGSDGDGNGSGSDVEYEPPGSGGSDAVAEAAGGGGGALSPEVAAALERRGPRRSRHAVAREAAALRLLAGTAVAAMRDSGSNGSAPNAPGQVTAAYDGISIVLEMHRGPGPAPPVDLEALAEDKRSTDCVALGLDPNLAQKRRQDLERRQRGSGGGGGGGEVRLGGGRGGGGRRGGGGGRGGGSGRGGRGGGGRHR